MKIDLKSLETHLKKEVLFHFEEPGNDELLREIGGKFLELIKVDLVVHNTGKIFEINGSINTVLQLYCSRCIDEIPYPINTDFYVTMIDSSYENEFKDRDFIIIKENEVDILPYIDGVIYSEIPLVPLCSDNCKGLCPICGTNKNLSQCHCKKDNIDPRWEKLKDFNQGRR
jgi:uncharacterized protein